MAGQVARQTVAEGDVRTPVGTVHVVDPHPLNCSTGTVEQDQEVAEAGAAAF